MGKTSIEWTDYSWPVLNGCRRVSPGCERCYAERLIATRLSKTPKYQGLAVYGKNGPRWTGEKRLWLKSLTEPFRIKTPSKIFVCDMGDLFFEENTNEEIAAVFTVMAANPRHTFQVLTKRAKRMREWFAWANETGYAVQRIAHGLFDELGGSEFERHVGDIPDTWPLPNVWLGVSVENQKYADERIPVLLKVPAAVRFLSCEPLLEAVRLDDICVGDAVLKPLCGLRWESVPGKGVCLRPASKGASVDWCIVGGESGPGARPFDLAWAQDIVRQCKDAGVACHVKQLGAKPFHGAIGPIKLKDKKGGDWSEWPGDLRVREFPRGAS